MKNCKHEPDIHNITHADSEVITSPDDKEFNFIMDITCKHCGRSGSFSVTVLKEDINW